MKEVQKNQQQNPHTKPKQEKNVAVHKQLVNAIKTCEIQQQPKTKLKNEATRRK